MAQLARFARSKFARGAGLRCACACALALAVVLLQCETLAEGEAGAPAYYTAPPQTVLEVAAELLRKQGYEVSAIDPTFLELQGQREEVAARSEGSLTRGTLVSQQVVVDAAEQGEQTRLTALFTVSWRRPTGERRTWVPESALSQRLRERFYADLHRELGE
jgi:hypothetical protein